MLLLAVWSAAVVASTVKRLDIQVVLNDDGSAAIRELWDIDLDDSDAKTEWYVAHKGLQGMKITQLQMQGFVPDKTGLQPFETLNQWNVDANRKEKTGKCGLNNDGQEICWGFGDWGRHQYVVNYVLTGLVKAYDTNDGFNHCFVDMNCHIDTVQMTIIGADTISLSEANTRRWSFGHQGTIVFEGNNKLVVKTTNGLDSGERVIVMLEFDKGIFHPAVKADEPWADRKQRAISGSDFEEEEWSWIDYLLLIGFIVLCLVLYFAADLVATLLLSMLLPLLIVLLEVVWWIISLSPLRTYRRRRKAGIAKGYYWRDVSPEWSLTKNKMIVDEMAYFYGMNDKNIIAALLLKLMARGDVSITREIYKRKMHDMLKIDKPTTEIEADTKGDEQLCQHLLKLLTLASGNDSILQPNEFDEWCKQRKNATIIKNFMKLLETKYDKPYIQQHAANLFGLKAYLKDFSLLDERPIREVKLWDQYMMYAAFFGIAEQVSRDMEQLWPEYRKLSKIAQSLEVATEGAIVSTFSSSIYTATTNAIERTASRTTSSGGSSGFSSFSSYSGGGGFSGGGGGGGR